MQTPEAALTPVWNDASGVQPDPPIELAEESAARRLIANVGHAQTTSGETAQIPARLDDDLPRPRPHSILRATDCYATWQWARTSAGVLM